MDRILSKIENRYSFYNKKDNIYNYLLQYIAPKK